MSAFTEEMARMRVTRYEEDQRLFHEVRRLAQEVQDEWEDEPLRHKHEDRDLTWKEIYVHALNNVMLMIYERLGVLESE